MPVVALTSPHMHFLLNNAGLLRKCRRPCRRPGSNVAGDRSLRALRLTPSRSPAELPFWFYEAFRNDRQCVAVLGGRGDCPRRAPVRTMSRLCASYFISKPSETHESRRKIFFFFSPNLKVPKLP